MHAGQKGLRSVTVTGSALTVGGGRLFDVSTGFFYENGCNSETESQKMGPKVGNERSL